MPSLLDAFLSGNYSPDATKNDAINQGLLSFGAGLIGAGRGGEGVMRAIQSGMGTYQGALDSALKQRLGTAQIADMQSQAAYRDAQAKAALQKLQLQAQQLAALNGIFNGESVPPTQPPNIGDRASNGLIPQPQGALEKFSPQWWNSVLPKLAGAGVDIEQLIKLAGRFDPKTINPGTYQQDAKGGTTYMPDPTKGVTIDPSTSAVSFLPGFLGTQTSLAGATEAAKQAAQAPYTRVPTMQNGVPGTIRGDQAAGLPGIGLAPNGQPTLTNPNAGTGFNPTGEAPRDVAVRATNLSNIGAGNENWTKNVLTKAQGARDIATESNAQLAAQRALMDSGKLTTGWGTEFQSAVGNALYRITGNEKLGNFATSVQSFKSLMESGVLRAQLAQAGVQTESDAKRMEATLAQLGNTPQANRFIIDYLTALNNVQIRRASFMEDMRTHLNTRAGLGTPADYSGIDSKWTQIKGSIWDDPVLTQWSKALQIKPVR